MIRYIKKKIVEWVLESEEYKQEINSIQLDVVDLFHIVEEIDSKIESINENIEHINKDMQYVVFSLEDEKAFMRDIRLRLVEEGIIRVH